MKLQKGSYLKKGIVVDLFLNQILLVVGRYRLLLVGMTINLRL
jgi:hypothetical protein